MTDASTPTPADWYSDPRRALAAPAGTSSNTVWIWVYALLPLLGILSLFTIDVTGYVREVLQSAASGTGSTVSSLALFTSPAYLLSLVGGWVIIGLQILFAALDWRALTARGVPQPFHWAFAFFAIMGFSLVYAIGRGIVAKRRTGTGTAPMVAAIIAYAVILIASTIYAVVIVQSVFSLIATTIPAY